MHIPDWYISMETCSTLYKPCCYGVGLGKIFFPLFVASFFSLSHTHSLSLSQHWEQSLHTIFSNATVLCSMCVVLMVSSHLSAWGDAGVFGDGKLGVRAWGIEKSGNPPSGKENWVFLGLTRGWTKGDQWTRLADLGRRFILEVCWFEDVANWGVLWWITDLCGQ